MNFSKAEEKHKIAKYISELELSELEQISGGLLSGFGTFEPRDRKEREGRNPKTGETMKFKL